MVRRKNSTSGMTMSESSSSSSSSSLKQKRFPRFRISVALPLFLVGIISLNLSLVYMYLKKNTTKDESENIIRVDHPPLFLSTKPSTRKQPKATTTTTTIRKKGVEDVSSSSIIGNVLQSDQKNHNQAMINNINNKVKMTTEQPIVIAHVVSLIKCTKQASVTGFLDAAAVLRHSIHKQSIHYSPPSSSTVSTPPPPSKYSYKMYAIVHEDCKHHAHVLDRLGYTSIVKPSPIQRDEIEPGWYKDHVEAENCCGSAEFIKLYAYTLLDHPIAVHWDMDVAILKPMDTIFDSMLYPVESVEGQQARSKLQLQHPERPFPERIDAFFTRDITSAQPWEIRQGVQGGFLVARPSMEQFQEYVQFIKKGNYTKGRGNDKGWGNLGYGGFQGAMAYQGAVAYYYDQIATPPNSAVELNACLWNQVVADVIWRGPKHMNHKGQCREYPRPGDTYEDNTPENGKCQDCRSIPVDEVVSAHYTACKKPWECSIPYPRTPKNKDHIYRLQHLTNVTTCGLLFRKWFDLRQDFEDTLERVGGVKPSPRNGNYEPNFFGGYCSGNGRYIAMMPPPEDFDISKMYGV